MSINTENIPEAEIVTDTAKENETTDLLQQLSNATEIKEPGVKEPVKKVTSFWDSSDDDFEAPKPPKVEENPKDEQQKKNDTTTSPLTDTAFKNSAENVVMMVEIATEGTCKIIVERKFKKKFTAEEKEALNKGLADANPTKLNEEQKHLQDKYKTLLKKKEETFEALPFSDDEKNLMTDAWQRYFKQKQIQVGPEAAVIMATLSVVGSRVIDVAFD